MLGSDILALSGIEHMNYHDLAQLEYIWERAYTYGLRMELLLVQGSFNGVMINPE